MSSDIYDTKEPVQNRRRSPVISQRRDEYLKATGGDVVPHRRRRHHGRHRRSSGWIAALFSLGILALLIAIAIWWQMSRR